MPLSDFRSINGFDLLSQRVRGMTCSVYAEFFHAYFFQFKGFLKFFPRSFFTEGLFLHGFYTFVLHGRFLHLRFSGNTSFYMGFSWEQGIVKQQKQVKKWGGQRPVG